MNMDPGAIITVLTGTAGVLGGFLGGRKIASTTATTIAVSTVELLQVSVEELTRQAHEKDNQIAELSGRVEVLEGLVTQRAEVAAVHDEVKEVRTVVDRIAAKVEA